MENASLTYEYGDYGEFLDLPVDCPSGMCFSHNSRHVAPLVLYAAIFLVGVPGNAMVIWVTWKEAGRSAGAPWFLHLAVADLLCCLSLPILAVPIAQGGHWPYGAVGCRALSSVMLLSMYASVLLLTALSADLCLLVLRPSWQMATWRARGVQVACGAAWVLALLLTVPSAIHRRLHQEHFPARLECVVDYGGSVVTENAVAATRFLGGFLGPLVIVAGSLGTLLCRGNRRQRSLAMAVIVGFFVCWTPYQLLGLVMSKAHPVSKLLVRALKVEPFVVGLALAHSCLNPLLFLYFGRAQLRQSLLAAFRWALRDTQGQDASVISKTFSSQEPVSEIRV
ncbi:C5a anaphylatoxin chemotactic receptor 2 [Ochotona curzoniae]|uniref:C5a anaphylatoxin chemotactic receptor 2 n=1 Tax=Ochotona curzoniae TaxID=130825 RepID=UPI001B34596D|nr:C5a anaphylatoxin chemotactic receptor 2 [Ochotona curzoniae]